MKIIKNKININVIVKTLNNGGLVIMPTETVYGAMVDATNENAVKKLEKYKNRPFGKPFSIAVNSQKMAKEYAFINNTAKKLYRSLLPGPLTIISKGKHKLTDGVESENGSIGIRIPDYKLVLSVVEKLGKPITATSANASYKKRPYEIDDVLDNLSRKQKNLIDLIVDVGRLPLNDPSTVIDTTLDDPAILRQGNIKFKNKIEILSRNEESTRNIGKELWQKYEKYKGQRAIVYALEGAMGTGKTQFTKGLALAMGIKDEVVSPTYDLELCYGSRDTKNELIHIDAWRMESANELADLDFIKNINDKSVVAIEWADRVSNEIRRYNEEAVIVWIKIRYGKKETERLISWGVSQ